MSSNIRNRAVAFLLQSIALAAWLNTESARADSAASGLPATQPATDGPSGSRAYDLRLPPECSGKLLVSKLRIETSPFFASPWNFGVSPAVRLSYGLTNLSGHDLHVLVNYRTEGKGNNTGVGACYLLAPGERRVIEAISPLQDFAPNLRFIFRLAPLEHAPESADLERMRGNPALVIEPLPIELPPLPAGLSVNRASTARPLAVLDASLATSNRVNWLTATITNAAGQARVGGLWVGVDHLNVLAGERPKLAGGGFFRRESRLVAAHGTASLCVRYDLPDSGAHPVLAYQVVECVRGMPDASAARKRNVPALMAATDVNLVAWGAADLLEAGRRGQCLLAPPVPLQERTNLTGQTKSPHFIFRYRPGSAAERDIEQIAAVREAVYTRLSGLYKVELPAAVQIDLYPDRESKGLGSGTRINVANTINASHIAEVYNAMTQVAPGHEIAHLFSYRFPGHRERGGELRKPGDGFVEGFAGCFEFEDSAETALGRLKRRLEGKPASRMVELIASPSPGVGDEQVALVDFLTRKSPEEFKAFYVTVIAHPDRKTIEQAADNAYKVSLATLETEWQRFLR